MGLISRVSSRTYRCKENLENMAQTAPKSNKRLWKVLREALVENKLRQETISEHEKDAPLGIVKALPGNSGIFEFQDTQLTVFPPKLDLKASITSFNNTGNIRIWPAEEAMLDYSSKMIKPDEKCTVLELGGGYANLCGMFLAKQRQKATFYLTDGNEHSVEHCQRLLKLNNIENASAHLIRWDQPDTYSTQPQQIPAASKQQPLDPSITTNTQHSILPKQIDYILISDCFFFDEFREPLATCISHFVNLNPSTKILLFGPTRNNTFQTFQGLLNANLSSNLSEMAQFSTSSNPILYTTYNC